MESPGSSRQRLRGGEPFGARNTASPSNHRVLADELSLYHLHKESSPSFTAGQDVLEIGWGDSPEPIHAEKISALTKTPIPCKKKLEPRESPRSSIPSKRRNIRSTLRVQSSSLIDIAKYVAEVQELSKNIMKELNTNKLDKDANECKTLTKNAHLLNNNNSSSNNNNNSSSGGGNTGQTSTAHHKSIGDIHGSKSILSVGSGSGTDDVVGTSKDCSFDNVLQSFINEEDEWLSQAFCKQDSPKTVSKISFVKCKSENELSLSQPKRIDVTMNLLGRSTFRRTSSFDVTNKSQMNGLNNNGRTVKPDGHSTQVMVEEEEESVPSKVPTVQYTQQEIERKRLEAIYRRERKEIERKKMEALKRLEMKKRRIIKT